MELSDSIVNYYRGEKAEAIILTFSGITVFIALLALLMQYPTDLTKGLMYPVLAFITVAIFAGSFNIYNNSKRLKDIPVQYHNDKAGFIVGEFARFEGKNGVNKWWLPLNIVWTLCILFGLILYFFRDDFYLKGVALGIVFFGFSGLLIDGFAKERADRYTKDLLLVKSKSKKER